MRLTYETTKTYKKIIMQGKTVYKLIIDGVTYYEEHATVDDAMKMARCYFAKNHSLQRAVIVKYTLQPVGVEMINKDYEEEGLKGGVR